MLSFAFHPGRRRVSAFTRSVVEKRHQKEPQYRWERLMRLKHRFRRNAQDFSRTIARWSLVVVSVLLLVTIGMLLFSPMLRIREIRVIRRDVRTDVEQVERTLSSLFGRHLLFLNPRDVHVLLQDGMVDINDVTVVKQYPSTLVVELHFDPLVARLHFEEAQKSGQEGSGAVLPLDYLTSEGVYVRYSQTPDQPEFRNLPIIHLTDWGVRPAMGATLLDSDILKRVEEASRLLSEQFGHEIRGRTVFLRSREFHILLDHFSLWFDMRNPVDTHLRRYKMFLTSVPLEQVREYVDLRLNGKVVYR